MSVEEGAVGRLARKLEALGIDSMVAGSVASSHHGLPRATNEVDIVVDPSPTALDDLVVALAAEGTTRTQASPARRCALGGCST